MLVFFFFFSFSEAEGQQKNTCGLACSLRRRLRKKLQAHPPSYCVCIRHPPPLSVAPVSLRRRLREKLQAHPPSYCVCIRHPPPLSVAPVYRVPIDAHARLMPQNAASSQDREYTVPSLPSELQGLRLTCVQTAQGDKRAGGSRLWRLSLMQVWVQLRRARLGCHLRAFALSAVSLCREAY